MFTPEQDSSNAKTSRHYQGQQVLRSINLTDTPFSGRQNLSRPLTYTEQSDSMNNLQLSISSEHSLGRRSRSNSISQNPIHHLYMPHANYDLSTTNNTYINQKSFSQIQETSTFNQLKERSESKFASIHETMENNDESKYSTFKRISDKKPTQLLSPVQEIFQSKVSEFHYNYNEGRSTYKSKSHNNSKSPQRTLNIINKSSKTLQSLQNVFQRADQHHEHDKENDVVKQRMDILIRENEKLIHINEELMNELETVRKNGKLSSTNVIDFGTNQKKSAILDDSKLVQQLKKEISQLHINQKKYITMNENYKQQISNLTGIISEQAQQSKHEDSTTLLKHQYQSANESLNKEKDQKIKLACQLLVCKTEIERLSDENVHLQSSIDLLGNQKLQWQNKLNIILDENERLNSILSERLQQADNFNQTISEIQKQYNESKRKRNHQESMLEQQIRFNEIQQKSETLLSQKNKEILALQQMLEENQREIKEQGNIFQLKEQIRTLENQLIEKNEQVSETNGKLRSQDQKWREKCKDYQIELKKQYKQKYKTELLKLEAANKSYYHCIIQQQQLNIDGYQQQILISQAEIEQLKSLLKEQQIIQLQHYQNDQEHVRKYKEVLENERKVYHHQITQLNHEKQEIEQQLNSNRNGASKPYILQQNQNQIQQPLVIRKEQIQIQENQQEPSQFANRNHRAQSFSSGVKVRRQRIKTSDISYQQEISESFGLRSKYNMLEENKKLNRQVLDRCTELMNKQFLS